MMLREERGVRAERGGERVLDIGLVGAVEIYWLDRIGQRCPATTPPKFVSHRSLSMKSEKTKEAPVDIVVI